MQHISYRCHSRARRFSRLLGVGAALTLGWGATAAQADEFTVGHSKADLAYSQSGWTGDLVGVAVLDSGIRLVDDLKTGTTSRIAKDISFVTGDSSTGDPCGHGTHVAGIIAGNGKSSTGTSYFRTFYGVARKAKLINVRVLNQYGQGNVSDVIAGIQWCITNKTTYNIRVMNLSLGHGVGESYTTDPLCLAVKQAWDAGIVVVCAAGNSGRLAATSDSYTDNEGYGTAYGSINSPGNSPYVITVGAMKQDLTYPTNRAKDKIATYSSRGPSRLDYVLKPDIVAPGNQIISTDSEGSYLELYYGGINQIPWSLYSYTDQNTMSNRYFRLSGTSMAAPVVSGAAALMIQKTSTLTPNTVKARLMITADKWTNASGQMDPCTFGAGFINITGALASTVVPTATAVSPTLTKNANGTVSISNVIWGSNIIWGLTGVTNPLNVIWGTNVLSGTSNLSSSNVIWGTGVWSDNVIWGTNAIDLSLNLNRSGGNGIIGGSNSIAGSNGVGEIGDPVTLTGE